MTALLRILTLTLSLSLASSGFGQDILLRLNAQIDAPILGSLPADSPTIQSASPVLEADKAADGWMWTEFTSTMEGYISTASMGKNFTPGPDSMVRAAPSQAAPILTTYAANDDFEFIRKEGDWATFRFTKPVPAYFQVNTTEASTPLKATADPAIATAVATTAVVTSTDSSELIPYEPLEDSIRVTYDSEPTAPAEPVTATTEAANKTTTPTQAEEIIPETQVNAPSAPRRPAPESAVTSRILAGKLVRETNTSGPRYPIRLLGSDGKQLAYVDMSRIFISDLRPYLNETVSIQGEVRPLIPGSSELIILARTIQRSR